MEQERELPQQPEVSTTTAGVATGGPGHTDSPSAQYASSDEEQSAIENTAQLANIGEHEAQPVVKKPIFLATTNPIIAKSIERFLFVEGFKDPENPEMSSGPIVSKDEYVFLITHHSVYHGLFQQWRYSEMEKEEQDRINRTKANDEIRDKAFRAAIELEYRIQTFRAAHDSAGYYKQHPEELMEFNYGELKAILNGTRTNKGARATRQDTWVLMDLLLLQGYIIATEFVNLQNTPKEKIRYKLVVSAADRKKALEEQMAKKRISIEGLNQDLAQLQMQLDEINQQIAAHANDQTLVTESSSVEETTDVD